MIQEKDFLYRVPVKTAPITTPGGQIRNPEILVDVEGGEFMHGNILDANSTNKLINQSVKDAVDNKLIESGYVTQDLLEAETTRATEQENSLKTLIDAETSARTKGDEDLSSKIKAEQTRAEGKEKEISDKLAIVDGDSNTEGSFRKAIADVVAAAPEDLDTLKEIADKLAGNDDLHTALNQAITEKADASALLNEVTRATGAESGLQAAIATKADATALSNYVLTTALNKQVDTLNAAINAKQDAGNYIPYDDSDDRYYKIDKDLKISANGIAGIINGGSIKLCTNGGPGNVKIDPVDGITKTGPNGDFQLNGTGLIGTNTVDQKNLRFGISPGSIYSVGSDSEIQISPNSIHLSDDGETIILDGAGIFLPDGDNNRVLTSAGSTINIAEYATKSDLSSQLGPKADRSDLMALEQKITANTTAIEGKQDKGNYITYYNCYGDTYMMHGELRLGEEEFNILALSNTGITSSGLGGSGFVLSSDQIEINNGKEIVNISPVQISSTANEVNQFKISSTGIILGDEGTPIVGILRSGIRFFGKTSKDIPTAGGTFISLSSLASAEDISSLSVGLSKKQNKITVNEVDVTDIETADIAKLRTIVTNLINALSESDLIRLVAEIQ